MKQLMGGYGRRLRLRTAEKQWKTPFAPARRTETKLGLARPAVSVLSKCQKLAPICAAVPLAKLPPCANPLVGHDELGGLIFGTLKATSESRGGTLCPL